MVRIEFTVEPKKENKACRGRVVFPLKGTYLVYSHQIASSAVPQSGGDRSGLQEKGLTAHPSPPIKSNSLPLKLQSVKIPFPTFILASLMPKGFILLHYHCRFFPLRLAGHPRFLSAFPHEVINDSK